MTEGSPFEAAIDLLESMGRSTASELRSGGRAGGRVREWADAKDVDYDDLEDVAEFIEVLCSRAIAAGLPMDKAADAALILALVAGYAACEAKQGAGALGAP